MATPSIPPRRFQPQPVATMSKSSRKAVVEPAEASTTSSRASNIEHSEATPNRRKFGPQPIETMSKSSRKSEVEPGETTAKSARKFVTEPVETTTKSNRKFAPQPIETSIKGTRKLAPETVEISTKSTPKSAAEPDDSLSKSTRRFTPQPTETSSTSSKARHTDESSSNTRRKFSPQPIETTSKSSRLVAAGENERTGAMKESKQAVSAAPAENAKQLPRRKFAPQLIETAKRSRKKGDEAPALLPSDMTEVTPGDPVHLPRSSRRDGLPTQSESSLVANPPRTYQVSQPTGHQSLRMHPKTRARQHSYREPDLEPIQSSESDRTDSDASDPPSLSETPSSSSDMSDLYKHATRMRDTVDEQYIASLMLWHQQAAEKQLREEAMAAFPNSDHHEGVAHYVDHDLDDEDDVDVEHQVYLLPHERLGLERTKRASEVERELAMQYTGKPSEELQRRQSNRATKERRASAVDRCGRMSIVAGPLPGTDASGAPKNIIGGWQRNIGLAQMRNAASPPMLGGDLTFPRCPSPEPIKFDVMHGSIHLRNNMCYLTEQTQAEPEGLWHLAQGSKHGRDSGASSAGLWGGLCAGKDSRLPTGPTGIITPKQGSLHVEHLDLKAHHSRPPSPLQSMSGSHEMLDEPKQIIKVREEAIVEEFNDSFVTQVYNYLSLGYPSVARKYDDELSRITKVPMEKLREDDRLASARGYIRLGDDSGTAGDDRGSKVVSEEMSWRWKALRLYIKEWARQQPKMKYEGNAMGAWGVSVRRGSWAF